MVPLVSPEFSDTHPIKVKVGKFMILETRTPQYKVLPSDFGLLETRKSGNNTLKVFDSDPYYRCELFDDNGLRVRMWYAVSDDLKDVDEAA